jgi:RNA polymerase sigma factor (sigma-70 family)
MADRPRPIDELLGQTAWVRRVAASLVRDAVDADDVVQSTWLAALRRPPGSDANLSGWLATVARNIVRKRARESVRRTSRELAAPDHREAGLSPESLVERAELQQTIATFVLELAEPFRSTLLLHYFEELSPSEIAAREGIPPATVRSRLKRGLDDLRTRLDRANGGKRRAWLVPVAALGAPPTKHLPLVWKGLLIMKTKVAVPAAVALLLAMLLFVGGTVARRTHRSGSPVTPTNAALASPTPRSMRAMRAWNDPLAPARSAIEGIVRGPDGKPLDGALVGAVPEDSDADDMHVHAVAFATSNQGGRFRIESLRPGAYAAQATVRGLSPAYRPGLIVLDGETVRGVDLRLEKGGVTITGHLHDAGGGVIAGGRLHARLHGEERPAVFTAVCDASGACPLTLAKGGYTLVAEADGYAPSKRDIVAMLDQQVDLQLVPAATLRGRVVERSSHAAVPNATVALTTSGSFLADSQVVADGAGAFEFRDLAPAEYQLSASKGKLAGRAASSVTISLGGYVGEVTVEVGPARTISGKVLGPASPIPNARVLLRPARSMSNVIAHVQTTADGRYSIEGLLSGAYQLRAESDRLAPAMRDVVVGDSDAGDVDLRLDAGSEVNGVVLGKEHQPIAGAVIAASVEDGEFRTTSAVTRTDSSGRFHLDSLGAGLLYVSASHPDHGSKDAPPARIAFGEKKELTLMLDASASVEGSVAWEDGAPAVGVTVHAGDASTKTDASGRYHLAPLGAGVHFVVATREPGAFVPHDPGGRQTAAVTLGSDEHKSGVDLVLMRAGHKIAGRVVGPDGAPVADAMVRADAEDEDGNSQASGDPRIVFKRTTSGADGSFSIEDLTIGHFTLTASHAGFPNASVAHVSADTMNARVQMKAEAVLEGIAVTSDGTPVADYALTLFASGGGAMLASQQLAVHTANGAFTLKGLAAGRYDLLAATADNRSGRLAEVSLDDGEHKSGLRIVLSQGTKLRGRVVEYGTGIPIPSAEVTVLSVGAPISTSTDGNGVFSVDGLPPGRVAWIAAAADSRQYVYDRIRVTLPLGKPVVDIGAIQLVPGDAAARSAAWTGIFPTNLDGVASVETVAPRSPAALAGVKPGDALVSVDGVSVAGLGFRAIYYFLGGQPGTKVTIGLGTRSIALTRVPDPQ